MTDLRKIVKRRTVEPVAAVRRRVIVALSPGDVIMFREEGRRKWYTAPVSRMFVQCVKWNADADLAKRRTERKAKREGREV